MSKPSDDVIRPDVTDVISLNSEEDDVRDKISNTIIPSFVLESIVLAGVGVLAGFMRFSSRFTVFQRTILCDDDDLKYQLVQDSTVLLPVSDVTLYCVSFIVPPVIFLHGELGRVVFANKANKIVYGNCTACALPLVLRRLLRYIGMFVFGAFCVSIVCDAIKLMTGYPRPYFYSVCQGYDLSTCSNYVTCTNPNSTEVRDARLSFPSYYATLSSYSAFFSSFYIHSVLRVRGTYSFHPVLVFTAVGLSLMAGLSRLMSYRNHWQDVLVGYALGCAVAAYMCLCVLNYFKESKVRRQMVRAAIHRGSEQPQPPTEVRNRMFLGWLPRISVATGRAPGSYRDDVYTNNPRYYSGSDVARPGGRASGRRRESEGSEQNSAFQRDLHRRLDDFNKKNTRNSATSPGPGTSPNDHKSNQYPPGANDHITNQFPPADQNKPNLYGNF